MSEAPGPALCGIILHPAGHTLSPVLHAEAYAELGLDARYQVFDVTAGRAADAVAGMRALGIRQLSVSLPLKEIALSLADDVGAAAREIGAANTLTLRGDRIAADNTDWIGVQRALAPHGDWTSARALVLGAGGAARAAVYALRRCGAEVAVHGRTPERVARLASDLGAAVGTPEEPWDLLINATPVGMQPEEQSTPCPARWLRPDALVFDTVYRPLRTRLLRDAEERGCRTQDGLDMLVHQAAEQVRLWSGREPSAERLRTAALRILDGD